MRKINEKTARNQNLIHIKRNIYVSKNEREWYKKILLYDKDNIDALVELAKEHESKRNYDKALDIYEKLSNKRSLLAKRKILSLKKKKNEAKLREIEREKGKFWNKLIKWIVVGLLLVLFLLLFGIINTLFFQSKTKLPTTSSLNTNDVYNVFKEDDVFLEEHNIFFYYGEFKEWEEPPENVYIEDMYADKNISMENLILNFRTKINETKQKMPIDKDKLLLNVREYNTQKILYQIIWDKNNEDSYKVFKTGIEGENNLSPLSNFNKLERAVLVDTSNNKAYILNENKIVKQFPISTGTRNSRTPKGIFSVQKKTILEPFNKYPSNKLNPLLPEEKKSKEQGAYPGHSEKSSNPYGPVWISLNKPHYGLHGTDNESTIGFHESLGCVRFLNRDIIDIYNYIEVGDYVFIK